MRLGKVLVLAHQDDGLGPEALCITAFFIRTVEARPVADGLGLADVSDPSVGVFLVLAKKDLDAGPYDFRKRFPHLAELISPERNCLYCRHGNLATRIPFGSHSSRKIFIDRGFISFSALPTGPHQLREIASR